MLTKVSSLQMHILTGFCFIIYSLTQNNIDIGWNLSTLTHILVALTILSGILGIYACAGPGFGSNESMFLRKTDQIIDIITEIDRFLLETAFTLSEGLQKNVINSAKSTRSEVIKIINDGFWKNFFTNFDNTCTSRTLDLVSEYISSSDYTRDTTTAKVKYWLENKILLYAELRRILLGRFYLNLWKTLHSQLIVGSITLSLFFFMSNFF